VSCQPLRPFSSAAPRTRLPSRRCPTYVEYDDCIVVESPVRSAADFRLALVASRAAEAARLFCSAIYRRRLPRFGVMAALQRAFEA
jgi:hypothetical protein